MKSAPLPWLGLALLAGTAAASAQLVSYHFDADTFTATTTDPAVSAGNVSGGAGLSALTFAEGTPATGRAVSASSWTVGAFNSAGNDYLEFTVAPLTGYTLTLTAFAVDTRRSGTGPASWQLRSNQDSFAGTLGSGAPGNAVWTLDQGVTLDNGFSGLTGDVTFRLYGHDASSSAGTLRVDNLELHGSLVPVAVPEPRGLMLYAGIGLLGWHAWRRRAGS